MSDMHYDCIVIGSGPGGYVAAIRAAQLGMRVACIDSAEIGGTCLNWGCIPAKSMLKSASLYRLMSRASVFGLRVGDLSYDLEKIVARSRAVVATMARGVSFLFKKNRVDFISGFAQFVSERAVRVSSIPCGIESSITFDKAIIAAGARSRSIPGVVLDGERVVSHKDALSLTKPPRKLLIVGAGAIGVEFSYFYAALGVEVTLVELLDRVLPLEDEDVSLAIRRSLEALGVSVITAVKLDNLEKRPDFSLVATFVGSRCNTCNRSTMEHDYIGNTWKGDLCLVAVGMEGNAAGVGAERLGIEVRRSFISVNEYYQTSLSHIYAVGDVIGAPLLAHVASHEGIIAAEHAGGFASHPLNYSCVPSCVFCKPEVASVGITQTEAEARKLDFVVGKFPFAANGMAVASGELEGFVKVLVDKGTEEILGVHIVHDEASALVGEISLIRSHEGIAASVFNSVHAHPTLTEAIMEAAGVALGRAIHI